MQDLDFTCRPERQDYESGIDHADGMELRVWLRLLTCTNLIDAEVRQKLGTEFDTTLPRFDILAQLYRTGEALSMGELSRRLMVTNGNVTGLIDRLVKDGHVERRPAPNDRRMQLVQMTDAGRAFFETCAGDHRHWISGMMGTLSGDEMNRLFELLGKLKGSIIAAETADAEEEQG